jgi:hypothetical protein
MNSSSRLKVSLVLLLAFVGHSVPVFPSVSGDGRDVAQYTRQITYFDAIRSAQLKQHGIFFSIHVQIQCTGRQFYVIRSFCCVVAVDYIMFDSLEGIAYRPSIDMSEAIHICTRYPPKMTLLHSTSLTCTISGGRLDVCLTDKVKLLHLLIVHLHAKEEAKAVLSYYLSHYRTE